MAVDAMRRGFCVVMIALAASVAMAAKPKREEVMLAELEALLAGSYDNIAQARANSDYPALRLMVVPVQAPGVGEHVFYLQEMAADDARRVLAQRLFVLNVVPGREQVVLTQLDFSEPDRWRDGHLRRDLFRALLQQDLRVRKGCDLVWSRKPAEKGVNQKNAPIAFTATTGTACRVAARGTGETLKVDQRMQLDADSLVVFEQQRDAAGVLVNGVLADPSLRFARRADAPW